MAAFVRLLPLILVLAVGCGGGEPAPAPGPLTLEQWKALPAQSRYEIDSLERLKEGNPHLQEPAAWNRFTRDVVLPGKKKEPPDGRPTR